MTWKKMKIVSIKFELRILSCLIQVNLFQKHLFLHQLTHNMTKDCSLIYQFNTWKLQAQNIGRTCCAQKMFFVFVLTLRTIYAQNMFSPCSELVVFMYLTGKSMNILLSYCGLVDVRINASDKDLPVLYSFLIAPYFLSSKLTTYVLLSAYSWTKLALLFVICICRKIMKGDLEIKLISSSKTAGQSPKRPR